VSGLGLALLAGGAALLDHAFQAALCPSSGAILGSSAECPGSPGGAAQLLVPGLRRADRRFAHLRGAFGCSTATGLAGCISAGLHGGAGASTGSRARPLEAHLAGLAQTSGALLSGGTTGEALGLHATTDRRGPTGTKLRSPGGIRGARGGGFRLRNPSDGASRLPTGAATAAGAGEPPAAVALVGPCHGKKSEPAARSFPYHPPTVVSYALRGKLR